MGRSIGFFLVLLATFGRMNEPPRKTTCHCRVDRLLRPLQPCWTMRNQRVVSGLSSRSSNPNGRGKRRDT